MKKIDINCDYGEDFGNYQRTVNEEILKYISSVNIACGFHAGDFSTMEKSVKQAMKNGVKIGAHPSFPDLQGFGRRMMKLSPREIYQLIVYQIGALAAFVKAEGGKLNHVKPHGALYNLAAVDEHVAKAITEAVAKVDDTLILFGLANSQIIIAGEEAGLEVANEIFADRTYQSDGTLTSRSENNALITDVNQSIEQVLQCVKYGEIVSVQGEKINVPADTVCIHGDGDYALQIAKELYKSLRENNVKVQ